MLCKVLPLLKAVLHLQRQRLAEVVKYESPSLSHYSPVILISAILVLIGFFFFSVYLFILWLINKSYFLKYGRQAFAMV